MVNDNLLSSPTAKKTVRFQDNIDHVTEAVSSNTNLSNNRIPSNTHCTKTPSNKKRHSQSKMQRENFDVAADFVNT